MRSLIEPAAIISMAALLSAIASSSAIHAEGTANTSVIASSNPKIIELLKTGKPCLGAFPTGFYGLGLGGSISNVTGWGRLSIFNAPYCTQTWGRFRDQCIVFGPGGVALQSGSGDKPLFYVPPKFIAFVDVTPDRQDCTMLSSEGTKRGREVDRLLFSEARKKDRGLFEVGISALRRGDYLDAAAYLGIVYDPPDAGYLSATMFGRGMGVGVDHVRAAYLMYRSASHGYRPAQLRLGEMYRDGIGVQVDPRAATYWFKQAQHNPNKASNSDDQLLSNAIATPPVRPATPQPFEPHVLMPPLPL